MIIDRIMRRGHVTVGISLGFPGFSYVEPSNADIYRGFDIDCAKALSTAIFGDPNRVVFIPVPSSDRFRALRENMIDVGFFNASANINRETIEDAMFVHPILYDGETFMHRCSSEGIPENIERWSNNINISAIKGSTTAENLKAYFIQRGSRPEIRLYHSPQEAREAYLRNDCQAYCLDRYLLFGERSLFSHPEQHRIRSERISFEYMSPVVALGDQAWAMAVSIVMKALIAAEEMGVNQRQINGPFEDNIHRQRLLRPRPEMEEKMGIRSDFVTCVVRAIGNYADIFDRNLGVGSTLGAPRAENVPRSSGGILTSPLFN